ncbi:MULTISPECIES: hypothetical protein [Alphaproteobacteria]|uniref:Antifreeze protein n=2 Tax=Alphaproteobacteria TaxID=28211 RepID=A0A512HET1_9HYPH|nr:MULTISPECIES: hypothetical protein [Alphaproteobacteria]GEO83860.1 hypothetical protein RNA01_07920 [Ciceribacter naphthalenivorans]GLR21262.1 hypothetical protein GCM10007920_10480 [Ciceribacter naphthalenivorans]GLT04118.1 hypothetical protein GCM10007926_10480 [Sphingomonas psychrolutea]
MTGMLAKLGLAALVTFATAAGTASTAAAGSDFSLGIYVGGPGYDRDYRDNFGPRNGWRHEQRRHNRLEGCSPRRAVQEARWSGLRRARVHNITPRRVVVSGIRYGQFDRMVFANVRGCPVIRY